MEDHILYRRSPIMIKTIPKGTLLFRLTKSSKDDLRGIPKEDGTRCILSNHNIYFYPNPFAGKIMLSDFKNIQTTNLLTIYVLKNDVKVLWLVKPSKYAKTQRNVKRTFVKKCSDTRKGCVDKVYKTKSHAAFNVCLSDTMIKKYPEIVGMVYISPRDAASLKSAFDRKTVKYKKYYKLTEDSNGVESIPELVLHPLTKRPEKDIIVKPGDTLDVNYKKIAEISASNEGKLAGFMEKHAVFDPETFFYTYKE
jgi:hypothetical protein